MERPAHDDTDADCRCFRCHVRGIQFSPSATPTRRSPKPDPGPKLIGNSWEKGVIKDARNMPYLDASGKEVTTKTWAESARRDFQDAGLA